MKTTTVGELIELLKQYPLDMPIGVDYDPFTPIEVKQTIWIDSNYPYDRPDFKYINLE